MTDLMVWGVLYVMGAGLAVGGIFVLFGLGWALLAGAPFLLYLALLVKRGVESNKGPVDAR